MAKNLVHLGKVSKPHGLKGELRVYVAPGSPFLLEDTERIYLGLAGMNPRPFRLLSVRAGGRAQLFALEGISGRDQAEKWRGADVLAREKDVCPDDSFVDLELIGCPVFLDNESYIGMIDNVWDSGAGMIWSIVDERGREVLFPAEKQFIKSIVGDPCRVHISPPPGLIELYS